MSAFFGSTISFSQNFGCGFEKNYRLIVESSYADERVSGLQKPLRHRCRGLPTRRFEVGRYSRDDISKPRNRRSTGYDGGASADCEDGGSKQRHQETPRMLRSDRRLLPKRGATRSGSRLSP